MRWKAEEWQSFFAIIPRCGIHGFVWGKCQRRRLTDRYDDGYDHMRRIQSHWQYRYANQAKN